MFINQTITLSPDKFGYYKVGDFKTYSKIEAIEISKKLKIPSQWYFNENVFSKINCLEEPSVDLWELYKQRARQIRENYDYVVLWYSGGSDSHNMLNAWIEADCKIDEIATIWNYEADDNRQSHFNAEITNVVLPDIEFLQKQGLEFKFRLVDISEFCLKLFADFSLNFEYFFNRFPSPNNPARGLFRKYIDDYKNIISQGKKLCFVWGVEKISLYQNSKGKFIQFNDCLDNCVSPYVQSKFNEGWYDELFYWSPDSPLIPIKQAHIINNFMKTVKDVSYYQDKPTTYGFNEQLNQFIKVETIKTLLYPKWSNKIFCNGKAASFVFSERDRWFLQSNLTEQTKYFSIMNSVYKKLGTEWISTQNYRNIVPHQTCEYYIDLK